MGLLKACSALNLKGGTLLQQPALKETGASSCPNVSHAEVMWAPCCRCRGWSSSLLGSKRTWRLCSCKPPVWTWMTLAGGWRACRSSSRTKWACQLASTADNSDPCRTQQSWLPATKHLHAEEQQQTSAEQRRLGFGTVSPPPTWDRASAQSVRGLVKSQVEFTGQTPAGRWHSPACITFLSNNFI